MSKPVFFSVHGAQWFTSTSPPLFELVCRGGKAPGMRLSKLVVESFGRVNEYTVDDEFLKGFGLISENGVISLRDRDKSKKLMNDRLVIQKIFREVKWVCPLCLKEAVGGVEGFWADFKKW
ncbi:MAG: hypothetical protein QM709_09945 [Spongiibacteraceae bacterium]